MNTTAVTMGFDDGYDDGDDFDNADANDDE